MRSQKEGSMLEVWVVPPPTPPLISGFWVFMGGNCPKQKWRKVSVSVSCRTTVTPHTPKQDVKIRLKLAQPGAFFWGIKNHWAGHGQNQNSDLQLFLFSLQKWSLLTLQAEPSPSAHRNSQFYTQFPPQYYWQMHCSHPFPALITLRWHSSPNISLALLSPWTNTLNLYAQVRTLSPITSSLHAMHGQDITTPRVYHYTLPSPSLPSGFTHTQPHDLTHHTCARLFPNERIS